MDEFERNNIPTKNETSANINYDNEVENYKEKKNNENHYSEKNMINNQNLEESNNLKKEKKIRIQEIMVGDRRLERFDGAEYNNPNLNQDQNQNINFNMPPLGTQFINDQFISPDQVILNEINNSENNFISFNEYSDQIYQNSNYNNLDEPQTQPRLNSELVDSPHPINQSPNQSQNFNSNVTNFYNNSPKNNNQIIIKDKENYKLFSSNNSKENENNFYSKNNNTSEKTSFMTNKNDEYINNNSNLQQNQSYQSSINNTQISQQINQEYYDLSHTEKDAKNMKKQYNQQTQMINQNQYKYRSEGKNFKVDVLYPKPGYGNSEEDQYIVKKKKKKKKIKYVRRLKPVVEQHFDMQIIQVPDISNSDQLNQEPQSQYSNNFPPIVLPGFPQKVIPHIPDKYKIKKSSINTQDLCNCPKSHREYNPIINNNSVQLGSKFGEQEINKNDFKSNCRPTQTLINITPMRTIYRPDSNNDITYNNRERYFRTEGYREYRPLTPINHKSKEKGYDEFERYGASSRVSKRKNSFSFYHKEKVGGRIVHSYENNEENNQEMKCTCCAYEK